MTTADPARPSVSSPGLTDAASNLLATLPDEAAAVRRAAFARLRSRKPANVAALRKETGWTEPTVRSALAALVATGTATLDGAEEVVAVAGLSVVPTGHELRLDGETFWTWCAFDAVGIPAALGANAVASTRCGNCGARLELTISGGVPPDDPVVGWLPGQACTNVQAEFCPAANLFCTDEHLAAWRTEAGDPPGQPATLANLAAFGARVWAEMRPGVSPRRVTPEEEDQPGPEESR